MNAEHGVVRRVAATVCGCVGGCEERKGVGWDEVVSVGSGGFVASAFHTHHRTLTTPAGEPSDV